ncbi:MAG: aminotransferase class I/II-fold pyridoxal phosphate-dependent enzyme [Acidimicrobiales bacterium]
MTAVANPSDWLASDLFWKVRADPRVAALALVDRADAMPYFLPIGSPLDREVVVDGVTVLMFGSNNYLGLAGDPRVRAAAKEAIDRYGTGCTGSRLMNGTLPLHQELEAEIADWVRREAAVVFTAGYLANLSAVSTLCGPGDVVVSDVRNHASLGDGARCSGADVVSVRHNDVAQLARKLERLTAPGRAILVAWDSVFSMDGDIAPLAEIAAVCRRHRARLLVDEAHSVGVAGPEAAGMSVGLDPAPDLIMGTFSKSLASCGGFIAGDRDVVDYLRVHAWPFLFTASSVPAAVGAALAALRICRAEPWRAARTREHAARLAAGLRAAGLDVTWGGAAVVSVAVADEWRALLVGRKLLEAGVYVNVGVFPAVPRGRAILRLSTTATHRDADVERCIDTFASVAEAVKGVGHVR